MVLVFYRADTVRTRHVMSGPDRSDRRQPAVNALNSLSPRKARRRARRRHGAGAGPRNGSFCYKTVRGFILYSPFAHPRAETARKPGPMRGGKAGQRRSRQAAARPGLAEGDPATRPIAWPLRGVRRERTWRNRMPMDYDRRRSRTSRTRQTSSASWNWHLFQLVGTICSYHDRPRGAVAEVRRRDLRRPRRREMPPRAGFSWRVPNDRKSNPIKRQPVVTRRVR